MEQKEPIQNSNKNCKTAGLTSQRIYNIYLKTVYLEVNTQPRNLGFFYKLQF